MLRADRDNAWRGTELTAQPVCLVRHREGGNRALDRGFREQSIDQWLCEIGAAWQLRDRCFTVQFGE